MQKKNSWKVYLKQQLRNPKVRQAFEEDSRILDVGIGLARSKINQARTVRKSS